MTRNQRRKVAAKRQALKLEHLASAELARRNSSIIARNVGQLRNGVRFERSGALEPKAYRDFGRHSGVGYVMGHAPRHDPTSMTDINLSHWRNKVTR